MSLVMGASYPHDTWHCWLGLLFILPLPVTQVWWIEESSGTMEWSSHLTCTLTYRKDDIYIYRKKDVEIFRDFSKDRLGKAAWNFCENGTSKYIYYVAGKRRQECSQVHRKSSHMVLLLFYALLVESMKHHTVLVPSVRCLQDPQITVLQCFP